MTTTNLARRTTLTVSEQGEPIRFALSRARISQRQLAREIGMDPGLLSRKVRGLRPWRLKDLLAIAEALAQHTGRGVSIDTLVRDWKE